MGDWRIRQDAWGMFRAKSSFKWFLDAGSSQAGSHQGSGLNQNVDEAGPASKLRTFAKHVRALCDRDHFEMQDLTWMKSLACWLDIFEGWSLSGQVGDYVLSKLSEKERSGDSI